MRHDIGVRPICSGKSGHRGQDAVDGSQRPLERELTEEHIPVERGFELPGRLEDTDGNGEVEERSLLAEVGGRQVHRDAVSRKVEACIPDGALDTLARFLDGGVRQPHDGEHRQAVGDVDLDLHGMSRQADDANARYCRIHRVRAVPE